MRGLQSSASDFEENANPNPVRGWMRDVATRAFRGATKRKARKLLNELIKASPRTMRQASGQGERSRAASGLINIIRSEPDGEDIVARRFVKKASRQERGIRALLIVSDDELGELGYDALNHGSKEIASTKLLGTIVQRTNEAQLFRSTISDWLRDDGRGVAAILYLATTQPDSFCANIDKQILLHFCKRVIASESRLSPKWYCGAKLFCILLMHKLVWCGNEKLTVELLSSVGKIIVPGTLAELRRTFERGPSLLPMITICCDTIRNQGWWSAFPEQDSMDALVRQLISFLHSEGEGMQIFTTSQAYALWTLLSLLESPPIANAILGNSLSKLGTILMDAVLKKRFLDIQSTDLFAKNILKPLGSSLDRRCIDGLCRIPESVFTEALTSALNNGVLLINNPNTANAYEPLGLVERLLWLSNVKPDTDDWERFLRNVSQALAPKRRGGRSNLLAPRSSIMKTSADNLAKIHRALVKGDACGFLAKVVSCSGNLDPQDRGLWRAKGLAMTCLGNIIEGMDTEQLRDHITQEMIDAVVTIREDGEVPELPKGQAILLLKRYTWAANSRGIRPFYSEDTSNLADEFKRIGLNDG